MSNLNEDQELAYNAILQQAKTGNPVSATLSGPAGTGKTYLAAEIARALPGRTQILAPTNAAAKVANGRTFHSFFGVTPVDPDAPILEFKKTLRIAKKDEDVKNLIVDEASMITNQWIERIGLFCEDHNINLIWMGDEYQLPPVGDRYETSEVEGGMNNTFNPRCYQQLKLTQPQRQCADSKILEAAACFRQYQHLMNLSLLDCRFEPDVKNDGFSKDLWKHLTPAVDGSADIQQRILGYTNLAVVNVNRAINEALHADGELFHASDTVVLNTPIWYPSGVFINGDGDEEVSFSSLSIGEDVQLLGCEPSTHTVRSVHGHKTTLKGYLFKVPKPVLKEGDSPFMRKFLLHYDEYPVLKGIEDEWIKECLRLRRSDPRELKSFNTRFKEFSGIRQVVKAYHAYAGTIHKAQGRTHEETIIMGTSLYGVRNDVQLYHRLAYVACTRPKKKLTIVGKIY